MTATRPRSASFSLVFAALCLGSAVCGEDFRAGPRTLEALGLADLPPAALRELLHEGA